MSKKCFVCSKVLQETVKFCTRCGAHIENQENQIQGEIPAKEKPPESSKDLSPQSYGGKEETLLSFGPMGVQIQLGKPQMFAWTTKNNTAIVITNKGVYGYKSGLFDSGRELYFQIPYQSVLEVEQIQYVVAKGVWIRYREGKEAKEICFYGVSGNYPKSYKVIREFMGK